MSGKPEVADSNRISAGFGEWRFGWNRNGVADFLQFPHFQAILQFFQ